MNCADLGTTLLCTCNELPQYLTAQSKECLSPLFTVCGQYAQQDIPGLQPLRSSQVPLLWRLVLWRQGIPTLVLLSGGVWQEPSVPCHMGIVSIGPWTRQWLRYRGEPFMSLLLNPHCHSFTLSLLEHSLSLEHSLWLNQGYLEAGATGDILEHLSYGPFPLILSL